MFYGNIAMLIHLQIIWDCFHAIMAHRASKIYYLSLYRKFATPIEFQA